MPKVKVISDVYVAATGVHHKAGTEDEVSDAVFARHGDKGTGFMKLIKPVPVAKVKK